jgi:outer membrane biosynthesis protein TonB
VTYAEQQQQPGMNRSALTSSAILHVVVLVLATVSFPWLKRDLDIPQPISVELVTIDKIAQTDKQAVRPEAKVPEKKEEKKIDKPPPAPTNKSETPKPPVIKPEKEVKKEEIKKEEKVIDELAQPEKKEQKKPDKKEVKKPDPPKEPEKDFASVLKNLAEPKPMPAPPPQPNAIPDKTAMTPQGANLPIGARMTMTEEDALRRQLEGCWNPPIGARDADTLVVEVFMVINPDRTLRSAQIVDTARYSGDPFYRAMADSAMRAVRSPNCSPFELPPDKYDAWKTATVTFDPSQMF